MENNNQASPILPDDGAADHLPGSLAPDIVIPCTAATPVNLRSLPGLTVVYAYPRTGVPGEPAFHQNWEALAGGRGCTAESCGFRDNYAQFIAAGARVLGMSTQDLKCQREAHARLRLPYDLLSDSELDLTAAMALPTFEVNERVFLKRLTMVIRDGRVKHAFYPVQNPETHALEVLTWLKSVESQS
jgi:peroxiredoxin